MRASKYPHFADEKPGAKRDEHLVSSHAEPSGRGGRTLVFLMPEFMIMTVNTLLSHSQDQENFQQTLQKLRIGIVWIPKFTLKEPSALVERLRSCKYKGKNLA